MPICIDRGSNAQRRKTIVDHDQRSWVEENLAEIAHRRRSESALPGQKSIIDRDQRFWAEEYDGDRPSSLIGIDTSG
jgi:hypothetical protein